MAPQMSQEDGLDAAMAAGAVMVVDESSSIYSDHEDDDELDELSTVRHTDHSIRPNKLLPCDS